MHRFSKISSRFRQHEHVRVANQEVAKALADNSVRLLAADCLSQRLAKTWDLFSGRKVS